MNPPTHARSPPQPEVRTGAARGRRPFSPRRSTAQPQRRRPRDAETAGNIARFSERQSEIGCEMEVKDLSLRAVGIGSTWLITPRDLHRAPPRWRSHLHLHLVLVLVLLLYHHHNGEDHRHVAHRTGFRTIQVTARQTRESRALPARRRLRWLVMLVGAGGRMGFYVGQVEALARTWCARWGGGSGNAGRAEGA